MSLVQCQRFTSASRLTIVEVNERDDWIYLAKDEERDLANRISYG